MSLGEEGRDLTSESQLMLGSQRRETRQAKVSEGLPGDWVLSGASTLEPKPRTHEC